MATEADINLAREMFNVFATGFDPGETGINFWADKIANQGYESTLQEFLNPAQGASAPRSTIMFADPEYRLATGTTDTAGMSDEQFRQAVGLVGDQNRMELDSSLRSWYDTYTGGRGMSTPVDAYVSMLNGRDGTYLSRDYAAAKSKMLNDAVSAGLYSAPPGSFSTYAYDSWVRQQTANDADIPTAVTTIPIVTADTVINRGDQTGGQQLAPENRAQQLFNLYATNFTPDQTALDFWNNRISTLGYDRALQEFLRPSDVNAPRNQSMFADPDYVAWARANGYTIPGTTTPGGTTPGGTTPGGGFAPGPGGGEVPAGMARFGGLNFFGTPMQQGFYSERGFEPNAVPFGQMAPGVGDAQSLFNTYATGFAPDQTALDFWNNKIATLGYQGALQQFLNPSDVNAPRNATMFQDPDYAFGRSQFAAGFTPPSPMPMATFRSGVSGYTPMVPTGFQFGVQDVLAPRVVFQPGAFDPGMVNAEGTWMPTLAFNQQQQNSIIAQQQAQAEDSGGD